MKRLRILQKDFFFTILKCENGIPFNELKKKLKFFISKIIYFRKRKKKDD